MYWNHRAMKRVENGIEAVYLVEVYYDNEDRIVGWTESETVWAESVEAMAELISLYYKALEKPLLIESEVEESQKDLPDPFDLENMETVSLDELLASLEDEGFGDG